MSPLAERARAALAQPAPEGPTDEELELERVARDLQWCARGWEPRSMLVGNVRASEIDTLCAAFLARWGRPTPQPADGEVAELVVWLRLTADEQPHTSGQGGIRLTRAADLLERLSSPQPTPVSERLPGADDCDEEGRCWLPWGEYKALKKLIKELDK